MTAAISVRDLAKQYKDTLAVDHISFDIRQGSVTALLGGNGAGKTTTIAMLLGVLTATSGSIHILGHDMRKDRYPALARMNFSSPYLDLPRKLTVRENLTVYARLYNVPRPKDRVEELAHDLNLGAFLDRPSGKLSAGQQTRVSLAKSLINAPDVLLLDEPTASLDPDTADRLRKSLLREKEKRGMTILLASHNMREVEEMCDHVLMMRKGRIVDQGAPSDLISRYDRADMEQVFLDIARAEEEEDAA